MSFKIYRPMSKFNHDYSNLYNTFNIYSLTISRKHSDMIFLHHLLNNKISSSKLASYISYYAPSKRIRKKENFFYTSFYVH